VGAAPAMTEKGLPNMKSGKNDKQYKILIQGEELEALKECCLDLPESFGLDRRIESYQGKRPIGFYRWDLDYLEDTLFLEVEPPKHLALTNAPAPALLRIYERIKELRKQAYAE
jgi:hypothetical protein